MADMTQTITLYSGAIPNRNTMDVVAFDAAASAWADWQEGLPGQVNTWATQANGLRAEISGWRTDVSGYLADAQTARTGAETAKTGAETAMAGAETAKTGAESARDAAESFADDAGTAGAIAGAIAASAPLYPDGSPYATGSCCVGTDGRTYRSLTDNNTTAPTPENATWRLLTLPAVATSSEMMSGTESAERTMTPLGVSQAIASLAPSVANYQEFLSSGSWVKPDGTTWVYIELVGAGGAGAAKVNATQAHAAGGGGGEFMSRLVRAQDLTSTVAVTVGGGGAGAINSPGGDGGNSSFGTYLVARGGSGAMNGIYGPLYGGSSGGGLVAAATTLGATTVLANPNPGSMITSFNPASFNLAIFLEK
jgi:hypothetical protein